MPSANKLIVSFVNLTINQRAVQVVHNELNSERVSTESNIKVNNEKLNFKSKIEIQNLSFRYGTEEKEVIKNINLQINKGEILGVIGETGSGKTTTLYSILKEVSKPHLNISPAEGVVKLKPDIKIGYVPQNI